MENIQYNVNDKYLVISQNRIQGRKYLVNKITIGELIAETAKSLTFKTDLGNKRISKRTISKMINLSAITMVNELFLIERIEAALV